LICLLPPWSGNWRSIRQGPRLNWPSHALQKRFPKRSILESG
jgi:hypothetical protein